MFRFWKFVIFGPPYTPHLPNPFHHPWGTDPWVPSYTDNPHPNPTPRLNTQEDSSPVNVLAYGPNLYGLNLQWAEFSWNRNSHVACHMSHVACHMSHVACHMSHVAFTHVISQFWGSRISHVAGCPSRNSIDFSSTLTSWKKLIYIMKFKTNKVPHRRI